MVVIGLMVFMMITIDGAYGEGGGQILRSSVALSALLQKPIRVINIRAKRKPPGLRPQHITAIRIVGELCKARFPPLKPGLMEITFHPSKVLAGNYKFNVGTAGSITLIMQAILPVAVRADDVCTFILIGGTDVRWSPTFDYIRLVKLPILSKMGYKVQLELIERGHYPKGGGKVKIETTPVSKLKSLKLIERGNVKEIGGISFCTRLPRHIAERQARSAINYLRTLDLPEPDVEIDHRPNDGGSPGSGIVLYAKTDSGAIIGVDELGERGVPAERVGENAARKLEAELKLNAPVDRHLADMLIPYMLIADGISEISVTQLTQHTLTCIHVSSIISGVKFHVSGKLGERGTIKVEGINDG